MRAIGLPELMFLGGLLCAMSGLLWIIPYWKIFSKAGFPGALSLLTVIPVVGLITVFVIAFSEWPSQRRVGQPSGPGL